MTYKVVFRRAAQREFADAALWYEERRGGLGAEFASEVNRAIESAAQNPNRCRGADAAGVAASSAPALSMT
jgi:plasmid stabilization system protein ParE